ncbi:hypothetical protein TNCV_1076791 [Trichonephila clavipes]|uniref:Uncharacterized protein n=1 Tax=Trichonephila clavipes TaxID=2585209 RepID=A0A8X6V7H2_TRICX|nr:hypothetical protein TNCV_1076791 [Trichonephila clavipes]
MLRKKRTLAREDGMWNQRRRWQVSVIIDSSLSKSRCITGIPMRDCEDHDKATRERDLRCVLKNPEGFELSKNGRHVTKLVAKNDANLALLPRFRQVPNKSPLKHKIAFLKPMVSNRPKISFFQHGNWKKNLWKSDRKSWR